MITFLLIIFICRYQIYSFDDGGRYRIIFIELFRIAELLVFLLLICFR